MADNMIWMALHSGASLAACADDSAAAFKALLDAETNEEGCTQGKH